MIEGGTRFMFEAEPKEQFSRLIETPRLILRPLSSGDTGDIYRLVTSSGDLHLYTHIPEHYSPDDARQWVNAHAGKPYFFVLTDKTTKEVMGVVSVVEFDMLQRRAEVGFWIGKAYRGHSFMAEALQAMVRDLFRNTQTEKVIGRALVSNEGSAKTLLRAGFTEEARLPKHEYHSGEMHDVIIFSILKS